MLLQLAGFIKRPGLEESGFFAAIADVDGGFFQQFVEGLLAPAASSHTLGHLLGNNIAHVRVAFEIYLPLDDFLAQMQAVRKMGSLGKLLGMLPGIGDMREQIENIDERELDRVSAIIQSMTPAERNDPKILNGSRRARIAKGSGTEVAEVNGLVERFGEARKMMASLGRGGGIPGMPGMAGPGGRGKPGKQAKQVKKAKRGSGNPARRVEEQRLAGQRRSESSDAASAAALDAFELPDEFKNLLPPG